MSKPPFDSERRDLEHWRGVARSRLKAWRARARARLDGLAHHRVWGRASRRMLAADAWLDSSLYDSGRKSRDAYERFTVFMDRFHVGGLKRLAVEAGCEAFTISIAGGLVLLALAIPAFDLVSDDYLKKEDLAITFLDRFGQEVGRRGIRHDDAVPFDELPPNLIHAVIATEDRRFFDHFGIDVIGTLRALSVDSRANGVVQGGSSLTQQLAKNLFLSNERTVARKVNEAFLALWLEWHLTKRQILGLYLDRAYLGGGTYGAQAAAQYYFGKSVRDLTLPEAAMIAGLFKAPSKYAPSVNLPAARARANDVLNNMVEAGYLTSGQIYAAQRNPATPVDHADQGAAADWYLDWAYGEVKAMADAGKFGNERVLNVRLALDPALQSHVEQTIEDQLREKGPWYHVKQAASVVLEPNGAVRAMVGGRDYGASQFNRATDALRQPGSSFKPYLYLTALATGRFKPSTLISAAGLCLGKDYCPHNYDDERAGKLPLISALAMSLNTAAIRLSIEVGEGHAPDNSNWLKAKAGRAMLMQTARKLGITTPLPDTVSLPLGAAGVKVIEHAGAYATFANGGKRVPPYATVSVTNGRGDTIYEHDRDEPKPKQVEDPHVIEMMNTMLRQVVVGGTGRAADIPGLPVAGKTGTTNGYHDAWFVGFTGNYVCAVWYGNDDYAPMRDKTTGGSIPAQTWHQIMSYAQESVEPKPVPGLPPPASAPPPASTSAAGKDAPDAEAQARPAPPAMLSKASVAALGAIASTLRVAQAARVAERPQAAHEASQAAVLPTARGQTARATSLP